MSTGEVNMKADAERVQELKERTKRSVEEIISTSFPKKILELDELCNSEQFKLSHMSDVQMPLNIPVPDSLVLPGETTDGAAAAIHSSSGKRKRSDGESDKTSPVLNYNHSSIPEGIVTVNGAKVYLLPNGTIPCNKYIVEMMKNVKPHIVELIQQANVIKMGIQFMIPRIEDGNNFGVSVQEDTQAQVSQSESDAAAYLDQFSRYFNQRAKILSKVAKYPHLADYRKAVQEIDEKQFLTMRLVVWELRNLYSSLHDLIVKNMDKIKRPRNVNHDTMY